ncbi:MAG: TIGR03905 family TSCPD domain-containing protein [Clostridia bacterium]|nr:TIGR03905 family TSCPD domain-containing protein [Clostridia bacterium]
MDKHVIYKTNGVCSRAVEFDIIDGYIHNVKFFGGCKGNTQGVGALAEGVKAETVVKRLKGIPCKGEYSCPDQLARAIEQNLA